MTQISILGCGWLGFPLALSLKKKGHVILGSTTSQKKLEILKRKGIEPYLIFLTESSVKGEIQSFLNGSDILILDVPPKMRDNPSKSFSDQIQALIPFVEASTVQWVLFVSSTSVFGDDQGIVNEATIPLPDSNSGEELLKSEKILARNGHFQTTILRFGGLTGEDRHPVKYLAGRKNLSGAKAPVNLIHRLDCIGIVEEILSRDCRGHVFHGVSPEHPFKEDYYALKAVELGLEPPGFVRDERHSYKIVESIKLSPLLDYSFKKTP